MPQLLPFISGERRTGLSGGISVVLERGKGLDVWPFHTARDEFTP